MYVAKKLCVRLFMNRYRDIFKQICVSTWHESRVCGVGKKVCI